MSGLLKREFAPVGASAWEALDKEASQVIRRNLVGRGTVDVSGPHGWDLGAVNLGRIKTARTKAKGDVPWATRENLPLVETRVPFRLAQIDLDSLARGSADPDLDPLHEAVLRAARFEDAAVFRGFPEGGIEGMAKASAHPAVALPKDPDELPMAVAEAVKEMNLAGVNGPYAVVLGPDPYFALMKSGAPGYPPRRVVKDIAGSETRMSPVLDGGLVISTRGGDFELTIGGDYSLGYASHDRETIEFFVTESFAFRVLEPKAAVRLETAS